MLLDAVHRWYQHALQQAASCRDKLSGFMGNTAYAELERERLDGAAQLKLICT